MAGWKNRRGIGGVVVGAVGVIAAAVVAALALAVTVTSTHATTTVAVTDGDVTHAEFVTDGDTAHATTATVAVTDGDAHGELAAVPTPSPLRVFVAREIVTMEPSLPRATAVAVADGRIVEVGSLESLRPWLDARPHIIDRRFERAVLFPGFIEPHLHPYLTAVLLPMHFITPHAWELPGRSVPKVRGRAEFLARLTKLAGTTPAADWLDVWGYHPLFHGELGRVELDAVSRTRPILVWHRSFHEVFLNTRALEVLGLDAAAVAAHPQVDFARGRFYENGLEPALTRLAPRLFETARYRRGLELGREVIHAGGITTVADMAFGLADLETEWAHLKAVWGEARTPFRTVLVVNARSLAERVGSHAEVRALIEQLPERNTRRLHFDGAAVKLFSDGAFYSLLMRPGPPGYISAHEGQWLMTPAELLAAARPYWNAGFQIHVHANGAEGVGASLDALAQLQRERPRFDHRYALHHFGHSQSAQARRAAALGAIVSANPFYVFALAERYAQHGLGSERASQMVRLGTLAREGVPFSLHSDFTMAPARPLLLASIAASRRSAAGRVRGANERITVARALQAVTVDAAHALRMEHEIGSIAAGKRADFVVLEKNPLKSTPEKLQHLRVLATILEGEVFPVK